MFNIALHLHLCCFLLCLQEILSNWNLLFPFVCQNNKYSVICIVVNWYQIKGFGDIIWVYFPVNQYLGNVKQLKGNFGTIVNKFWNKLFIVNEWNLVKNPNWQEADQLVTSVTSQGVELRTTNNTSWWSECMLQLVLPQRTWNHSGGKTRVHQKQFHLLHEFLLLNYK